MHGAGLVDCHLYQQHANLILHLVNLTGAGTWRAAVDELISNRTASGENQAAARNHGTQRQASGIGWIDASYEKPGLGLVRREVDP